jgi:hypothetical protein
MGDSDEALALALRHQLLTPRTSFLVVAEREAKAEDLPVLHQVPHMLAAGMFDVPTVFRKRIARNVGGDYGRSFAHDDFPGDSSDGVVAFSIAPAFYEQARLPVPASPDDFVANLNRRFGRFVQVAELPGSLDELESYGLPADLAAALRDRAEAGGNEATVVIAFLHALCESALAGHFERGLRRLIRTAWKRHCADSGLDAWLTAGLTGTRESAWNWNGALHREASATS